MTWTLVDAPGILEVLVEKFVDFGLLALTDGLTGGGFWRSVSYGGGWPGW
jgi:hypothetical protein